MVEDISEYIEPDNPHISWKAAISKTCKGIEVGLLKHNVKYGSSIFRPVSILSAASAEDMLRMRIDDRIRKLPLAKTEEEERELLDDLLGYLVNLRAYMATHKPEVWGDFE